MTAIFLVKRRITRGYFHPARVLFFPPLLGGNGSAIWKRNTNWEFFLRAYGVVGLGESHTAD
jgi:hypothetical protein